jgi:hypothetical protein
MLRELKSFHRQASKNIANYRDHRKQETCVDDIDQPSDKALPDKIVESEIKGDFEVDLLQPDG